MIWTWLGKARSIQDEVPGRDSSTRDGANKLLRRYTYGLDLLSQTTSNKGPYWYHHDGLGSVTDVTSATGASLAWTEYTPFGAPRATAATSQAPVDLFRFTGEYRDGTTGLYHLRARQYDPSTGRFTAVDPISPGVGDPYVGAYGYVGNNPVRWTDPSGRCPVTLLLSFLGGLAGSVVPGPGTLAGAAGGATVGAAFCFAEIAVEGLVISNAVLDQNLFKGATRRELERELRDAGYLPKPGSGRGGEEVWERQLGGRPISLPRHREISPGVTKNIRDTLRNLSQSGGFPGSFSGQGGFVSNGK